jgi:formate dehydrogenase major subunit
VKRPGLAVSQAHAMLCYTLGITEHTCGKNNVMSVANLQMLLGNMGMECGGVNPLRGQNNVQGACDMGALPNVFPGYQRVTDAACGKNSKGLGRDGSAGRQRPDDPPDDGRPGERQDPGFYIFGENLANTEPDIRKVEHELASAEFLVCQDIFPNETTRFAHVVLPAAAWSENDGTFTNSERRVSRVRTASPPRAMPGPTGGSSNRSQNASAMRGLGQRPGNLGQRSFGAGAPVVRHQIPPPGRQRSAMALPGRGAPRHLHPAPGRPIHLRPGHLHACRVDPPAEVPDDEYPLVLSTGRRLTHYHTRTQTGRCEGLNDLLGEETADISPVDANLGISHGEIIRVSIPAGRSEREGQCHRPGAAREWSGWPFTSGRPAPTG